MTDPFLSDRPMLFAVAFESIATVQLGIKDGRIERIWSMRNPAKLRALGKARRLVTG